MTIDGLDSFADDGKMLDVFARYESKYGDTCILDNFLIRPYAVAGGRALHWFDKSIESHDVDVWCMNWEEQVKKVEEQITKWSIKHKKHESENAVTFNLELPYRFQLQIIKRMTKNAQEAISRFDMDICSIGVDFLVEERSGAFGGPSYASHEDRWVYDQNFMEAYENKRIGLRKSGVVRRILKYVERGFFLSEKDSRFMPDRSDAIEKFEAETKKAQEDYSAMANGVENDS